MLISTYTYSDTVTFSCDTGFVDHFQYFACQGVHGLEAWGSWGICLTQCRRTLSCQMRTVTASRCYKGSVPLV